MDETLVNERLRESMGNALRLNEKHEWLAARVREKMKGLVKGMADTLDKIRSSKVRKWVE